VARRDFGIRRPLMHLSKVSNGIGFIIHCEKYNKTRQKNSLFREEFQIRKVKKGCSVVKKILQ